MPASTRHRMEKAKGSMTLIDEARAWHSAGYTPLPVATDGSKRPGVRSWKQYQTEQPDLATITQLFAADTDGIGLVTGTSSGNFELLEAEGRAVTEGLVPQLAQAFADHDLTDLWTRIAAGYMELTPSGGIHWYYRVDGPAAGNTKLARRPATDAELAADPDDKIKVLFETRGEGGFTVIAPSAGRTHPTGKPWLVACGSRDTIPTITVDERDALYAIAGLLDAMPAIDEPASPARPRIEGDPLRPGDDFNARATWHDILTPHGWKIIRQFGGTLTGWQRPGKRTPGLSATTGRNDADNLYVFSTSTEFEPEKPYSKFAAWALLEHGGDYSAAAKALRADGYGEEAHRPVTTPFEGLIAPHQQGNLAKVIELPEPQQRPLKVVEERTLAHSDDANALALVDTYGDVLRHCSDRGRWYAWDGTVWAECPRTAGPAREYAKRIARALPEVEKKEIDHKKRSLSAIGISAMLTQAASDTRISVTYDQLDANPWELNTPGGIINLRTGELQPHDPAKLHTRITTCAPDSEADPTRWKQFLATTFGGDQPLINYLQRLIGYSTIGTVGAHVLPFCFGSGGNGKGVFLEAPAKVLGGYATTAPAGFLMAKQHPAHETEIARLSGARMVLCSEVNEEDRFDEAKVKQLTGGDTLTARFMHQDHFTFEPTHQLWLMGNHRPNVRSGGRSFWRRLRQIPFEHEVPSDQVVDDLQGILANEHGPAILAWIVEGAVAYAANGLDEPASVIAATDNYAYDQDTVTRFIDEMCILGGGENVQIKVAVVRAAYERWCDENGEEAVSAKAFGMSLGRVGIESKRTKSARMYLGLTLSGEAENASPAAEEWYR